MNATFSSWNTSKNEPDLHQQSLSAQQNHTMQARQQAVQQQQQNTASQQEDKFDPSFARQDHENDGFPSSVVDEVAAAAVVAQKRAREEEEDDLDDDKKTIMGGPNGGLSDISSATLRNSPAHRELSGTKRALQNRKAQRAFRQRKEKYVKDLEMKANEVDHLKQTIEELRNENMQLRDYTLALQSRVIELSPPNIQSGDNSVPTPPAAFNGKFEK